VSNTSDVASDAQQDIVIFPGNASWRPTCEHFLQVDDECAKHKSKTFWTQEQRTAIQVVFIVFGCIAIILNIITATLVIYYTKAILSSFHIILFLSICDILRSISGFAALNTDPSDGFGSTTRCQVSAMSFQFFSIGALGWIISFSIYFYFNMKSPYDWDEHRVKTITGFHIFTWGTALLLAVLPALIHKSFGSAGEGNWCWIRDDELVSKIAFHDSVLLLATAAFVVSCILTRKVARDDFYSDFPKFVIVYAVLLVFQLIVAVMDVTLRAINPCCPIFAVTITMAFASSLRAICNPILGFAMAIKHWNDNCDDD